MLASRRCVIPAEGFYEWREEHGKKQPYFFARKDGKEGLNPELLTGDRLGNFAATLIEPSEALRATDTRDQIIGLLPSPNR
jgi:hypothetical protein